MPYVKPTRFEGTFCIVSCISLVYRRTLLPPILLHPVSTIFDYASDSRKKNQCTTTRLSGRTPTLSRWMNCSTLFRPNDPFLGANKRDPIHRRNSPFLRLSYGKLDLIQSQASQIDPGERLKTTAYLVRVSIQIAGVLSFLLFRKGQRDSSCREITTIKTIICDSRTSKHLKAANPSYRSFIPHSP